MSEFAVRVVPVRAIEPIPNADRIELAVIGEFRSVVLKGQFEVGALVAYIPEASVLPETLLVEMGLVGKLAGGAHNRVKAVRLRGCLSQGLCYPARDGWIEGWDVTEFLGITKYVPAIPAHLAGEMNNVGTKNTIRYDVENWKAYPDVFAEGEQVVFTEKIHGTFLAAGLLPDPLDGHGDVVVTSKGLGGKGLAFKMEPVNDGNLYVRTVRHLNIPGCIRACYEWSDGVLDEPVFVLGEVYGVQDLRYGASPAKDETIGFRVFDIFIGYQNTPEGRFLNDAELTEACEALELPRVPVLYRGPYSRQVMEQFTTGIEAVSGEGLHVREGIVIRSCVERRDDRLPINGRAQLKSISADYLTRRGKKGEEPTEFE